MAKKESWRLKLSQARELRKRGAAMLFDRVVLLCELYGDEDFTADVESSGGNVLDFLDTELDDVAVEFLVLKSVYHHYPNVADWEKHNIRDMIAEVLDTQKKERTRNVPTWKERALAAEKECERLRGEMAVLHARVDELRSAIGVKTAGAA